ncbi:hypothetical protein CPB83DRAFT_873410 [Crepidotus variabilis]|uniref:ABC transporter domain-containing protein n=1 Tax=Crepidotus variabilis TaxID=179855 RepID=A0A9P6ERS8_9AGAR|nr:hypothetical protein CPB83DRAFT_873410 [Crepidotus variabilis]
MLSMPISISILALLSLSSLASARGGRAPGNDTGVNSAQSSLELSDLLLPPHRDPKCPPCFNCLLPAFTCGQFAECNKYDGQCKCPPGWSGIDCLTPQCDSLSDGEHRRPRQGDKPCECKEGWGGINCNVCKTNAACTNFPLPEWSTASLRLPPSAAHRRGHTNLGNHFNLMDNNNDEDEGGTPSVNMTCYTGGETVVNNHQMCDVTNRKILDMLPDRPPQVTFSCLNTAVPSLSSSSLSSSSSPHSPLSPHSLSASPSNNNNAQSTTSTSSTPSNNTATCAFQFYTAQIESFYCSLSSCSSTRTVGYEKNETRYACEKIKCQCVPGRFICGEDGSVDIGEFLTEEIRGPASFSCESSGKGKGNGTAESAGGSMSKCKFEEPAMNNLINDIFGEPYISLECAGGECLREDMVPGYVRPPKPDNTLWVAVSVGIALGVVLGIFLILWYASTSPSTPSTIRLPPNESYKLMSEHIPASLHFTDISYALSTNAGLHNVTRNGIGNGGNRKGRKVLKNISGSVHAGEMMAIMGASGAGKSTLLDILAGRTKSGVVGGGVWVNGREKIIGYVDQEDTLMHTLTVYETVLYSALLRLPREMSWEGKVVRVEETLSELGLLSIRHTRIGSSASGTRGISGGEKRRVSIACELVTSPSILFLDEPTSGLDAYNAFNVMECLKRLCVDYKRTVVCTIHQPRSNIVSLFDRMVVIGRGRCVFSGPWNLRGENEGEEGGQGERYWESIGKGCPRGFNVADYMIDLTMHAVTPPRSSDPFRTASAPNNALSPSSASMISNDTTNLNDPERALLIPHSVPLSVRSLVSTTSPIGSPHGQRRPGEGEGEGESTEMQPTGGSSSSITGGGGGGGAGGYIRRKASRIFEVFTGGSSSRNQDDTSASGSGSGSGIQGDADDIPPALAELLDAYETSPIAQKIREDGDAIRRGSSNPNPNTNTPGGVSTELPNAPFETTLLRGRKRASYATQFRILSGRAFKNLYRDPALLAAHYIGAVGLAGVCGMFYYDVSNDISGFQNRLGIFFFTLALFGFSCLSSLGLFANERILFMRERANGYYSTFTYFSSKILFDILPLRLVPPLMFGGIVYGLVGLVPTVPGFWKFMLTLVLFNLTTASVVLWLSIAFASTSVASLVGTLIMLFNLLFTGLLINRESVTPAFQWLHTVSFFHAAFEALAVNELRYLQLKEVRYGVELDLPAATILSIFGLRAQSFWWPNISLLAIFFLTFTTASFLTLHFFVKEKR